MHSNTKITCILYSQEEEVETQRQTLRHAEDIEDKKQRFSVTQVEVCTM